METKLPAVASHSLVMGGFDKAEGRSSGSLSKLEMFFIIYTSFGLGQFFNTFISLDVGKYIFAGYVHLLLLACWWCLLVLRKQAFKWLVLPVLIVLGGILAIEMYHVWRIGVGRGHVTGVRAILYSPLYAPLINLVVFSLVLHEYASRRMEVIKFVVTAAVWMTVLGMAMWVLVFVGVVRFPESEIGTAVQVLNNNTGAYVACFVVYCLHFTSLRREVSVRRRRSYTVIAVASILLYTSRGAILVLACYVVLLAFRRLWRGQVHLGAALGLGGAGVIVVASVIVAVATSDSTAEYYYVFSTLSWYAQELKAYAGPFLQFDGIDLANLTRERPSDSLISAVGRVFASLIALETFRAHALVGVGTYTAYSIEAYGTGIHSLPFLYSVSSGMLGLVLLAKLFQLLAHGRRSVVRHHLLYLLPVGIFLNIFPLWYACCFFLDRAAPPPARAHGVRAPR